MDTLYLDNIDEYVLDQDKIVTYKWLSLTLGVHVNTAKRMLFHYLEHKRKRVRSTFHRHYLLCPGNVMPRPAWTQQMLKTRELMTLIYLSDSRTKIYLIDSRPLNQATYDQVIPMIHGHHNNSINTPELVRLIFSAIRCPDAVPLSNAELLSSRETPQPPPAAESQKTQTNTAPNLSNKTSSKPKGIMGAFAKSKIESKTKTETKPEPRAETKPESTEKPVTESKAAPKPSSVTNFFGTQTTKKPASSAASAVVSVKEESSSTRQRPPQASRETSSKSKRKEESDSEEEVKEKKKRRRIRRPQDSSSDEEQEVIPDSPVQTKEPIREEQPSPEPIREEQPSPEPIREEQPVRQETSTNKTRKRRRVLKSKTFLDDDGSIVTEKGYVRSRIPRPRRKSSLNRVLNQV
ncbi:hypothetical protein WMY93_000286 [Mugilogobius chulae]|uniref:DNA polymerase delta subunit 3 n=1 Tax=Mugilogobius chulae TaxID=88201 RepID=A0AAW0PZY0_9GOBI